MSDTGSTSSDGFGLLKPFKKGWEILRTVYWYNSIPWRLLKSAALVVVGFFCLSGANLLHSYKPHWDFLLWIMGYGFLLIVYGPIHHLIVIPGSLKLNHYDWGRNWKLGKRIPFWTLIGFFVAVGVVGVYPPEMMTFKFTAEGGSARPDINPTLNCELSGEDTIRCSFSEIHGIALVEVHSGGEVISTEPDKPYELVIPVEQLREVVGQKQFQVVLKDSEDRMIRRYVRTLTSVRNR
jgi:hypothetical protein